MKISKELKVGILTIIAGVILYIGFNFLKGKDVFSTQSNYYAIYDNVEGLKRSNEVQLNGVPIGRVINTSIINNAKKSVLVEFELNNVVDIAKDSKIVMKSQLVGDNYLTIINGKSSENIVSGDTLVSEVESSILDGTDEIKKNLKETLATTKDAIGGIDSVDVTQAKLNLAIDNFNRLMISLDRKIVNEANAAVREFTVTGKNLNNPETGIGAITKDFKKISGELKEGDYTKTMSELNQSIESLNAMMAKINRGEGSLGKLVTSDSLHQNLNSTLLELKDLLHHFNTNPKHFLGPLAKSKKKIERDLKQKN